MAAYKNVAYLWPRTKMLYTYGSEPHTKMFYTYGSEQKCCIPMVAYINVVFRLFVLRLNVPVNNFSVML